MEAQVTGPTTILTLELAPGDQAYFEQLRQQHYPVALNRVPAHVTLFHTLPPLAEIRELMEQAARRTAFALQVTGLRSLGRGVALLLQSPELVQVQRELASAFAEYLTAQDRQSFKPHIVIQNKARPDDARQLKTLLEASFHPFTITSIGLTAWNYLNGPWQRAAHFPFGENA